MLRDEIEKKLQEALKSKQIQTGGHNWIFKGSTQIPSPRREREKGEEEKSSSSSNHCQLDQTRHSSSCATTLRVRWDNNW
jgi:hypothetical protein